MPTIGTMKYLTIGDSTYEVYNTDTEVIQTYAAASGYTNWRPLVVGYSSNSSETTAPTTTTGTTYTFNTIKVKPSDGIIRFGAAALYNGDYTTTISADTLTADRILTAPDKSGTIALTSDIPSLTGYATTTYVDDAIATLPEPMLFKGSVGTGGTITSLPTAAVANEGFTYKVITALSTPVTAKVGDTVISTGSEWVVIPSGDEPSGTVTSVGLSNATNGGLTISGSPITSSGSITVGHSNVLTSAQTTQAVYPIKIDKNGHISEYGNAITIPEIPSNNVTGSGSTDYLARWSGTNTLSSTSLYINTSYNSSSDEYGTIRLFVGNTGQIDWRGQLVFHDGSSSKTITITPPSLTASRTLTLPDKDGTIALTSDLPTVPTNVSAFTNDAGYLTSYTETDPTVPSWAKASSKPSYQASEISGLVDMFYPVGSYYETSDTTFNPNTAWTGTTWVLETEGQVHISGSTSGTYQVNGAPTDTNDGGASTVTLTTDEIPAHTHGSKQLKGSATAYNDCGLVSGAGLATGIFSKQATPSLANYRLKWEGSSAGSSELNIDASHEHDSVGLGQAHNNMMPYIIVNRWHRTA